MSERGDEAPIQAAAEEPTQAAPEIQALAEHLAEMTDSLLAGQPAGSPGEGGVPALAQTVARLRAALCAEPPSPAFVSRLRDEALAAFPAQQAPISERLREVIRRLLGDEGFRRDFVVAPETTLQRAGIELSSAEMAALKRMEPDDLQEWAADLDERISKSSGLPW
jgi:hypothetical protein